MHRRPVRTYEHTAFAVRDRYDILYGGHESDASVSSGRRRRFLNWYGFHFSTTLWMVHPASYAVETRASFPGVKWPAREADRSRAFSAEVIGVEMYLHSHNTPSWRGAQLKHRDNFTFTFTFTFTILP
jgi:hypothetical protein